MSHQPSFAEFCERARRAPWVTVHRRLTNDVLTPVGALYRLDEEKNAFLLESVVGGDRIGRHSFVAVEPFLQFEAFRERASLFGAAPGGGDWSAAGEYVGPGDPLEALRGVLERFRTESRLELPQFCGGAVGHLGYDTVRYSEHLPSAPQDDRGLPDLAFDFYDSVVIFDHVDKTLTITAHGRGGEQADVAALRMEYEAACGRIDRIAARLGRPADLPMADVEPGMAVSRGFDRSNFKRADFQAAVQRCRGYIEAGDIFQVVLSQRFEADTQADPFSIYRALRIVNPSPYMFFLRRTIAGSSRGPSKTYALIGSSPEIMVRVEGDLVTTRPLAGTRPRGKTPGEDAALAEELLADPKERAEHVMLVDLGRNDVGRIARYGTVELPDVMSIERYSHVMHISSTVTGRLREGLTAMDALRACLPAGTVSGAPKVRAMEIIDELEPHRRGPYAGAVGFVDFTGDVETCLALRTLVATGDKVYIQAGAGIVHDSVPEKEYEETINKAQGLLKAIEIAESWRRPMSNEEVSVLSGIQPTARRPAQGENPQEAAGMHIGNYFGAIANWVKLQESRQCVFGVVDLHAMTMPYDPERLRRNTHDMFVDLLACGIDPQRSTMFVQSLVPEHAELSWVLSCLCAYGDLGRMTQFKDKSDEVRAMSEDEFVSAGLFTYPVLQAADILVYRARFVPVGKDQEQHLELSRRIARRFNHQFGEEFFPEPQPLFTETPKIMSLADPTKKMSKSLGPKHFIGLFEDEQRIRKKVRSAVTDTGGEAESQISPGVANLFEIVRACGRDDAADALLKEHHAGTLKYVDLKDAAADALIALTQPLRRRREEVAADKKAVEGLIRESSARARDLAAKTLKGVRRLTGLAKR